MYFTVLSLPAGQLDLCLSSGPTDFTFAGVIPRAAVM
jgi:hypothetical protein